jgi:hypothetical protein
MYHLKCAKSRNRATEIRAGAWALQSVVASAIKKNMRHGIIEVDLFSWDVDSADHPEARKFKKLLNVVAKEYRCKLTSFDVEHGTVSFSFDSDVLVAEILKILETKHGDDAE